MVLNLFIDRPKFSSIPLRLLNLFLSFLVVKMVLTRKSRVFKIGIFETLPDYVVKLRNEKDTKQKFIKN